MTVSTSRPVGIFNGNRLDFLMTVRLVSPETIVDENLAKAHTIEFCQEVLAVQNGIDHLRRRCSTLA